MSGCADMCEPIGSTDCKQAPTLSSILMILYFITANHGIRTQITNEIRTFKAFTDNQSHAFSELGAAFWVTMSQLRETVGFKQKNINLTQPLK